MATFDAFEPAEDEPAEVAFERFFTLAKEGVMPQMEEASGYARKKEVQNKVADMSWGGSQALFLGKGTFGEFLPAARERVLREIAALLRLVFGGEPPNGTVIADVGSGGGKLMFDAVKAFPWALAIGVEMEAEKWAASFQGLDGCVSNKTMSLEEAKRVELLGPFCAATHEEGRGAVRRASAVFSYDVAFAPNTYEAMASLYSDCFASGTLKVLATTTDWSLYGLVGAEKVGSGSGYGVSGGARTVHFFVASESVTEAVKSAAETF